MIKHVIISRFATTSTRTKITKDWVDHRLNLLENYCYPSVENQTCDNFTWIVTSHKRNLTDEQLDRLNKMSRFRNILLRDDADYDERLDIYKSIIFEGGKDNIDIVITSRLDCDDAIHRCFVQEVQKNCMYNEDKYILNFSAGYEYDVKKKLLTIRSIKDTNMFISLVEKVKDNDSIKTVVCDQHQRMRYKFTVHQLYSNTPFWIQFIHGSNIFTKRGYGRKVLDNTPNTLKKDFNVLLF